LRASSALGSAQAGHSALSLARALYGLGDHTSAAYVLDEAAQFFKEADDRSGEADVFLTSSDWSLTAGDFQEALDLANASLSICAEIGDTVGTGRALNGAGWDLIQMGHPEKAKQLCEEALTLLEAASDLTGLAITWDSVGECHRLAGSFDDAIECFTNAASLAEDIQAFPLAAEVLTRLGECHEQNRDPDGALRAWSRAAQALQREAIPDAAALAALRDRIRRHTGGVTPV
jgi:tetratricopeptide (TPR) repeat protein